MVAGCAICAPRALLAKRAESSAFASREPPERRSVRRTMASTSRALIPVTTTRGSTAMSLSWSACSRYTLRAQVRTTRTPG